MGRIMNVVSCSTENIPAIYAFQHALEAIDIDAYQVYTRDARDYFVQQLKKAITDLRFHHADDGLTNTVSVSFDGVFGHHLAIIVI